MLEHNYKYTFITHDATTQQFHRVYVTDAFAVRQVRPITYVFQNAINNIDDTVEATTHFLMSKLLLPCKKTFKIFKFAVMQSSDSKNWIMHRSKQWARTVTYSKLLLVQKILFENCNIKFK